MSDSRPLTFFGGKGGVGKTTMAAASAVASARSGRRTLIVSTDPAHSLGDTLGTPLSGQPTEVLEGLFAVEIDADAAAAKHIADISDRLTDSIEPELLPTVRRHLDLARSAPGTLESALFDVMSHLMDDCPGRFERIVFDTAPTGHTLRLLALPALLSAWVEGLVRQREKVAGMERMLHNMAGRERPGDDPMLTALHERRGRFERAARRLVDDAAFWLVLVPERLPIEETARAERALTASGVHVAGLVLNRILPDHADGEFLASRRSQQQVYEAEVAARFGGRRIVRVMQRPRDVSRLDDLDDLASALPTDLVRPVTHRDDTSDGGTT